jgi:hypothetical protein
MVTVSVSPTLRSMVAGAGVTFRPVTVTESQRPAAVGLDGRAVAVADAVVVGEGVLFGSEVA